MNAGATRRRRRAWPSPSMVRMDWRRSTAGVGALELGCLLDDGEPGVEALVAQDGGHVRQPRDGVPQLVAGEPVHGPGRLHGVDGVLAVEPDHVERGELELRDQLWHGTPRWLLRERWARLARAGGSGAGPPTSRVRNDADDPCSRPISIVVASCADESGEMGSTHEAFHRAARRVVCAHRGDRPSPCRLSPGPPVAHRAPVRARPSSIRSVRPVERVPARLRLRRRHPPLTASGPGWSSPATGRWCPPRTPARRTTSSEGCRA